MRTIHLFLIDSDHSGHRLSVDGKAFGRFTTFAAAEEAANDIARRFLPAATLTFTLAFNWTLSELEVRTATLECEQEHSVEQRHVDR